LKIVKLTAENVKKLVAVEITPNGDIVNITGRNGVGKTSVLDAIWWALDGTSHIQTQPIRKGENKARIRLDMGEIIVERRFGPAGSQLAVESADGARYPSPQKMLDALLGELSFDPLAFARMEPRKQFDELRRVAKLKVDIDKLDGLNRADYAKRTDVNRQAKAKRAQAGAIVVAPDLPDAVIDETAILDEIEKAGEHNTQLEQRKARRVQAQRDITDKRNDAQRMRDRATALREEAAQLDHDAKVQDDAAALLERKLQDAGELPEPINVAEIRVRLEHTKQVNAKVAARMQRQQIEQEAADLEAEARNLTERMDGREKDKAAAIAEAAMPVEGLGFGEGVVTYNGIPLDQASSAEQLKVSLAIAMAANPKVRVIRIQDGSLLDDESLAQIAEMAKANDYQVWIERVDTSGKLGVYIEDGAVVAVDGEPVKNEEAAA
jgi:energy-coupling factor transporter ATP-binding protein EcfA2